MTTLPALRMSAQEYAQASISESTRRSYQTDWTDFLRWMEAHRLTKLPARPESVAAYLSDLANRGLKPSTITRRATSLSVMHKALGFSPPPTAHEAVRRVLRGIRRTVGDQTRKVKPLTSADLRAAFTSMNGSLRDCRDRAMLAVGLSGALRRSELAAITVEDLEEVPEGFRVTIPQSKTGPRTVGVAYGKDPGTCPVLLLRAWLAAAGISEGPVFRPVGDAGEVAERAVCGRTVALAVKRCAAGIGKDPNLFGGHSLRRGFCTETAAAGASERSMAAQTGHKSYAILRGYIDSAGIFTDNAVSRLGL